MECAPEGTEMWAGVPCVHHSGALEFVPVVQWDDEWVWLEVDTYSYHMALSGLRKHPSTVEFEPVLSVWKLDPEEPPFRNYDPEQPPMTDRVGYDDSFLVKVARDQIKGIIDTEQLWCGQQAEGAYGYWP